MIPEQKFLSEERAKTRKLQEIETLSEHKYMKKKKRYLQATYSSVLLDFQCKEEKEGVTTKGGKKTDMGQDAGGP